MFKTLKFSVVLCTGENSNIFNKQKSLPVTDSVVKVIDYPAMTWTLMQSIYLLIYSHHLFSDFPKSLFRLCLSQMSESMIHDNYME